MRVVKSCEMKHSLRALNTPAQVREGVSRKKPAVEAWILFRAVTKKNETEEEFFFKVSESPT